MVIRFRMLLLFAALAVSTSCLDFEASFDEVARVTNPTGKFDAVLAETNGGATTSFGYEVFIVGKGKGINRGKGVATFYAAGRNEHAYGVNLKWVRSHSLMIQYLDAEDANLQLREMAINNELISISLCSGISDSDAPPGGMLYNLEKKKLR